MSESALNEPRVAEGYDFDFEMPRLAEDPTAVPAATAPNVYQPDPSLMPPAMDSATAPRLPGEGAPPQMTPPPTDIAPPPLPNTVGTPPAGALTAPPAPTDQPAPMAPPVIDTAAPAGAVPPAPPAAAPAPALPTDTPATPPAPVAPTSTGIADVAADVAAEAEAEAAAATPDHPMAHLMPKQPEQSEASKRAAEIRAAKKKKAKKIKIGATIAFLAVAAVVGPPLGKWLVDAVNEAGSTGGDDPPPVEQPADEPLTPPDTEQGRIDELIDDTRDRIDDVNDAQP